MFYLVGVTLALDSGSVGVASLPAVLMEREVNEVRRGRPAVALNMVQVSAYNITAHPC